VIDEHPRARYRPHDFIPDELFNLLCRTCGQRINDSIHSIHEKDTPMIPFTMTNDSITVILDGKTYTVQANTPQYHGLRDCIFRADWDAISKHVSSTGALQQWLGDKFTVDGRTISYGGEALPESLSQRIWTMATAGESSGPLFAFYERLSRNPSRRSVQQLWDFLAHTGIPLEPDGTFLAYKGVRIDFLDQHSSRFDNSPGQTHMMPRNQISDDPRHVCHEGFHVGALQYASGFATRVVIVRVDPEHVVCVPYDHSYQKMRVCQYTVVGNHVGVEPLASTTYTPDVVETDDAEWGGDVEDLESDDDDDDDDEGEDEGKSPPAVVVVTNKPTKSKAAAFNRMNPGKLMEQSFDELRKYASAHLKIVGASKLPGGKSALVSAICKVRRRRR
jgi:hypothetical protein